MPEIPVCIHCRKPVNQKTQDYVVTNKEEYEEKWKYAHAQCQEEHAGKD